MNDTILGYNYVCQSQMIGPMQERSLQFGNCKNVDSFKHCSFNLTGNCMKFWCATEY